MSFAKTTLFTALAAMSLVAADDPFVGNWKYNPAKSRLGGERTEIQSLGDNKYRFVEGLINGVVIADGTEQATPYGETMSFKQLDSNRWRAVHKKDARVLDEVIWDLSPDGKSLQLHVTYYGVDGGKSRETYVNDREGDGHGIAGVWVSRSSNSPDPDIFEIQTNSDGYRFVFPGTKDWLAFRFDGKEYVVQGPHASKDMTYRYRRIDSKSFSESNTLNNTPLSTTVYSISEDGRTLSLASHGAGQEAIQVYVYERQ